MSSSTELRLAADFEPADRDAWRRLALGVLTKSGALSADDPEAVNKVEAALSTTTYDDITVSALYMPADLAERPTELPGFAPFVRGRRSASGGWDIRQLHNDPDPQRSHEAIMTDLENGVTSLWLVLGQAGAPVSKIPTLLDGVLLDLVAISLDAGPETAQAVDVFLDYAGDTQDLSGTLGFDPIGLGARTGTAIDLTEMVQYAPKRTAHQDLALATIDATVYADAGASDSEELGVALATGVAYLQALNEVVTLKEALQSLEFRLSASANQFLTIAKMRAARKCWARIAEVCGAEDKDRGMRQHAVTSSAMMSARDPWVNMLRVTLASFGAGVGGADAVTSQPFDARFGLPDALARRMARNTQSLLQLESHVAKVIDPAGGSSYVESLTKDLADAAWRFFTQIEKAGGAAHAQPLIADRIEATWARRAKAIALRKDALTGVSEYPNLEESLPQRTPAPVQLSGGLPRRHYDDAFETLRTKTEAHGGATVFLATLGALATYTGRASFATNLFATAGIQTESAGVTDMSDPEALAAAIVNAFEASGASVACLCSSDKVYSTTATTVTKALRDAGAKRVWLAGPAGSQDGIEDYLFTGCDAIEVATLTLLDSGVKL